MKGIYKITNILDGKYYVGSTLDHKSRWGRHRQTLNNRTHKNTKLQHAWNFWGETSFIFEMVEQMDDTSTRADVRTREDVYLAICKEHPDTNYNLNFRSDGGDISEEARQKIKNTPRSAEWRRKIGEANRRRKVTDETRAKISKSLMGHVYPQKTDATRKKLRLAITGLKRGPMSDEHRERLRVASIGKKHSTETIAKMRQLALQRPPKSAETRRKMSDSAKKRVERLGIVAGRTISR
jgi:group I intron endonuclease